MVLRSKEMPRKKIQHKGKSNQASEENDGFAFRRNDIENSDDEYTSVVNSEANKKYCKRLIQNNWSKYEDNLSDFESENEDDEIPKTDDFNHLLKTASSDCSHFQFNSEKLWKSGESSIPPSSIFNLDLNILSSGLACVPFYERIGLDESYLSKEDKQRLDAAAQKSLKEYTLLREKLFKEVEDETKVKNCENLGTLDESFKEKLILNLNSEEAKLTEGSGVEEVKTDISIKKVEVKESNIDQNEGGNKSKIFLSENDEDLEDWLDSVLDE